MRDDKRMNNFIMHTVLTRNSTIGHFNLINLRGKRFFSRLYLFMLLASFPSFPQVIDFVFRFYVGFMGSIKL